MIMADDLDLRLEKINWGFHDFQWCTESCNKWQIYHTEVGLQI
jgi:hypothetical protein